MEPIHHQLSWHQRAQSLLKKASDSNKASMIMAAIGMLLIAIIIFQAGMLVGIRKGRFMATWNANYHPSSQPMPNRPHGFKAINEPLPVAHGTAGQIIAINLPMIIVKDSDGTEKTIVIREGTTIRSLRDTISATALSLSDMIVVIGTPNEQGYIQANFIRVMSPVRVR